MQCAIAFEKSFASCEKSKHWSKKNELHPRQVSKSSQTKFWFDCNVCNHEFESRLSNISQGCWCPYCTNKKLCGDGGCKSCTDKSFASCEKSKYWSKKNTLQPIQVSIAAHKKIWFDCNICNHEFESYAFNISRGIWCPYCTNQKLCDDDKCKICFDKSFASSSKAKYWSKKNNKVPRKLCKTIPNKYLFDCDICKHEYEQSIESANREHGCPFCQSIILCNNEKCEICFKKSFASHERSNQWSNKNDIKPRNIFKNTHDKYWFVCKICSHEFESGISGIVSGQWCPFCAHIKLCNNLKCDNCFTPLHI